MSIKFTINETPRPKGRKGKPLVHARQVSEGTYKLDYICNLISERSAVSSAEVKSVLDSFAWIMEVAFTYGYHLELADLGYFSPSLRTHSKNETQNTVEVDGVNFRCSATLLKKLKGIELKQVKIKKKQKSLEERKERMLEFLEQNGDISPRLYAEYIGCSRYRAEADIKHFLEEGILMKVGYRKRTMYLPAKGKEDEMTGGE